MPQFYIAVIQYFSIEAPTY